MDSTNTSGGATPPSYWRKCSSCKNPIGLGARYYVCSVSTCNSIRTNYVFCSVHCFERHLPGARHKDAAAIEMTAPMKPDTQPAPTASAPAAQAAPASGQRVFAKPSTSTSTSMPTSSSSSKVSMPREVLVIASRLKDYITARSEFNTSQSVMDVLSDHLRTISDRAIDNARAEGRKTVMDRDFEFLKR